MAWSNRSDRLRQAEGVLGVLEGFAIIGFVILIEYLVGRFHLLGPDAEPIQRVLS